MTPRRSKLPPVTRVGGSFAELSIRGDRGRSEFTGVFRAVPPSDYHDRESGRTDEASERGRRRSGLVETPPPEPMPPMNPSVQDAPAIPGLVLLAETGRDAVARRFRVQAERPVTLYWFNDATDPKGLVAEANAFAAAEPTGFAPVLRAFVHGGRAGVLLGCERAEDAFDGPPIGEDAMLLAIRPIVAGLGELAEARFVHGRLRRALALQHDGTWTALPPFCVARDPKESPTDASRRDALGILELVVHAVCGGRLSEGGNLPPEFEKAASPRLLATVRRLLAVVNSGGDALAELLGSYLAPREAARSASPVVAAAQADRSQRRAVFTVLAFAAPIAVFLVMAMAGGFERAKGFLRIEEPEPESTSTAPTAPGASVPNPAPVVTPPTDSPAPAIDDSAATRALAEKILSDIRASAKPAPAAPTRHPELIEAERLEEEGKKLLVDIRDKKVEAAKRNETLLLAIEKLESARTKVENLTEQNPALTRQLEVVLEDLNALIFHAYRLKTRD